MESTLVFDSMCGYAQKLPSGDLEIQPQRRGRCRNVANTLQIIDGEKLLIPKEDAEKLARFVLNTQE